MSGATHHQATRLRELHRLQILDTAPEPAFERIVELAQEVFGVPTVLISLIDEKRQWFKARRGFEPCETDLTSSFCTHTIAQEHVMVIPDTTQDERFRDTPLVKDDPFFRFYAGAPLITHTGHSLGTLCLLDLTPRSEFNQKEQKMLTDLASMVLDELELRLTKRQAQQHAEQLKTVLESTTDAIYQLNSNWCFSYLNPQAETILKRTKEELLGCSIWSSFPDTEGSVLQKNCFEAVYASQPRNFDYYYPPLASYFEVRAYPSDDGLSVYFTNINERMEARRRAENHADFRRNLLEFTQKVLLNGLEENFHQELLESAVQTIPGAQAGSLLIRREDGHHFIAAVGFDIEALSRCTFKAEDFMFDLYSPEPQLVYGWEVEALDASQRDIMKNYGLANDIAVSLCIPILINDKPYLSLYLDNFDTPDAFDEEAIEMARVLAQQVVALMQRKELEVALLQKQVALEQLAHYDTVTGLPNRRLFDDRLQQAVARLHRTGEALAVLLIDLDNFKQVNDAHGHSFGDRLLKRVATRLLRCMREGDTLARWGGDEFVVLISELADTRGVIALAERLLDIMKDPFVIENREVYAGATLGIAISDGIGATPKDLLKNADSALYCAKTTRGTYQVFSDSMREEVQAKVELGTELRMALKTDALTVHYQPRVDLVTGRIASLEALARWNHPTRGWVPPSVFIPLAEELRLIQELGAQVLDKACRQAKAWERAGVARRIAVNLSIHQLQSSSIVEDIERVLSAHDLRPELLELEITESTAMTDVERNIEKLKRLRSLGVHLAIDDFGTAYSSLAYLDMLPVHTLKIDRSFVNNILDHQTAKVNKMSVVQTIIALGKSLDLCVVAEGVETQAQCTQLQRLGCDEAQGYFFAIPMAAADVDSLVRSGSCLLEEAFGKD